MPAFRMLVLLTLLLPSLPLGDAFRVNRRKHKSTHQALSQLPPSEPDDPVALIGTRSGRRSIPNDEFSLSHMSTKAAGDLLKREPQAIQTDDWLGRMKEWGWAKRLRNSLNGVAPEWLLFEGGYTLTGFSEMELPTSATPGNDDIARDFHVPGPIEYIPSNANRLIAFTVHVHADVVDAKKVVVFCHNNGANIQMIWTHMSALSQALQAALVGFEYPGYGDPGETTQGYSTLANVKFVTLAGVNWIRQVWEFAEKDIIMAGHSIGTGVAAEVAYEYEVKGEMPLGGLILISPYSSIWHLLKSQIAGLFPWFAKFAAPILAPYGASLVMKLYGSTTFETAKHLGEMSETPVFAMHAKNDLIIPYAQFKQIKRATKKKYKKDKKDKVGFLDLSSDFNPEDGHNFDERVFSSVFQSTQFRDWITSNQQCLKTPPSDPQP